MINKELSILIIAYDGYSDIWKDCVKLLQMNWPDCSHRILFINNEKDISFDGVEVVHAGRDAEWSKKVQLGLELSNTKYVCILLEDFLVGDRIDNQVIQDTIKYIDKHGIRYYKTVNMSRAGKNRDPVYDNKNYLHIIPASDEYGISMQAAIWERNYLTALVGKENYNAWQFEFDRVNEAKGHDDSPNPGCVFDDRNIFKLQHGIIQGKYLPGTIRYFKKRGITLNVQREIMSYDSYYRYKGISLVKSMIPRKRRDAVKRLMEKLGVKFVSTTRK